MCGTVYVCTAVAEDPQDQDQAGEEGQAEQTNPVLVPAEDRQQD